jgi:hypothetical protein
MSQGYWHDKFSCSQFVQHFKGKRLNECQRRKIQNTDSAPSHLEHSFYFVMHRFDIVSNFDIRISCFWLLNLFRIMRLKSRRLRRRIARESPKRSYGAARARP